MPLHAWLSILNTLVLIYIAFILTSIWGRIWGELDRQKRQTDEVYRFWFRRKGRDLRDADDCSCSEVGPCMSHYGMWFRWLSGATEAWDIGREVGVEVAVQLEDNPLRRGKDSKANETR